MAEPKRLRAMLAIIALIQGMTGVRVWDDVSFEYPNPPHAELGDRELASAGALYFPWFGLTGGFGSRLLGEGEKMVATQQQIPDEFHILVIAQFRATADQSAEVWLQRGYEDFRRTMFVNTTLGGLVRAIGFGEYRPYVATATAPGLAEFEQDLAVIIDDRFTVG